MWVCAQPIYGSLVLQLHNKSNIVQINRIWVQIKEVYYVYENQVNCLEKTQ